MAAKRAWPRLAEYFARFFLSRGLGCSLEVLAPTLAKTPLFIRPPIEDQLLALTYDFPQSDEKCQSPLHVESHAEEAWHDFFEVSPSKVIFSKSIAEQAPSSASERDDDEEEEDENERRYYGKLQDNEDSDYEKYDANNPTDFAKRSPANLATEKIQERKDIQKAVEAYFCKPVELRNIAHSLQTIRRDLFEDQQCKIRPRTRKSLKENASKFSKSIPMLEVDLIVLDKDEDEDDDEEDEDCGVKGHEDLDETGAKLMLIRMVNKIPLLDGAEAQACGLVRGVTSKHSMWESFGLEVVTTSDKPALASPTHQLADAQLLHVPMFNVRDSAQVASYLQSGVHDLYCPDTDSDDDETSSKPKRFLPAKVRLGNLVLIVHIHAHPSALPLPTLSKVSHLRNLSIFHHLLNLCWCYRVVFLLEIPLLMPPWRLVLQHVSAVFSLPIQTCFSHLANSRRQSAMYGMYPQLPLHCHP